MNSDFVVVRQGESGVLWFWTGRGWWSSTVEAAHVYATREKAERAIQRNGWGRAKYATLGDLMEEGAI